MRELAVSEVCIFLETADSPTEIKIVDIIIQDQEKEVEHDLYQQHRGVDGAFSYP